MKRSGLWLALTWILFTHLSFGQAGGEGATSRAFVLDPPIKVEMNRSDLLQDTLFKGSVTLYKVFRDVSFVYILMYGVALSVALAFGQAQVDAILNYFLGSAVVVGANVIASIYFAVYSIKLV